MIGIFGLQRGQLVPKGVQKRLGERIRSPRAEGDRIVAAAHLAGAVGKAALQRVDDKHRHRADRRAEDVRARVGQTAVPADGKARLPAVLDEKRRVYHRLRARCSRSAAWYTAVCGRYASSRSSWIYNG